ncbi:glycosyltransferase [Candidatus Woesearchaeota archaeon]|nr:glycosyltransferase [Candidatus Woesearchaeota archaeon]
MVNPMSKDLSIIVPIYNGGKTADKFLSEIAGLFSKDSTKEVIVVNDGSTDNTSQILDKYASKLRIINHDKNKGKGWAVRTGIMNSAGRKIVFIDGDGAFPLTEIQKVAEQVGTYDIVLGMKRHKQSQWITSESKVRKLLGKCFNLFVNVLFQIKVKDCLCGLKGFKSSVAKDLFSDLMRNDWIFDVEILYKAKKSGYSIGEVPVKLYYVGDSKFTILDPLKMIFKLLRLRYDLAHQTINKKEKTRIAKIITGNAENKQP